MCSSDLESTINLQAVPLSSSRARKVVPVLTAVTGPFERSQRLSKRTQRSLPLLLRHALDSYFLSVFVSAVWSTVSETRFTLGVFQNDATAKKNQGKKRIFPAYPLDRDCDPDRAHGVRLPDLRQNRAALLPKATNVTGVFVVSFFCRRSESIEVAATGVGGSTPSGGDPIIPVLTSLSKVK